MRFYRGGVPLLLVLLGVIASRPARADDASAAVDEMPPLASELLARPFHLTGSCSRVVIREWEVTVHGTERARRAFEALDALCHQAVALFPVFARNQGLKPQRHGPLDWSMALIPDGYCFRCMNDIKHRFTNRFSFGDVWAFTSWPERYIYLTNLVFVGDAPRPVWRKSVIHELWHAQSMSSGIYDHHATDPWDRYDIDERYAERFTAWVLGGSPGPIR